MRNLEDHASYQLYSAYYVPSTVLDTSRFTLFSIYNSL